MKKLMITFGTVLSAMLFFGCSSTKTGNPKKLITAISWELSSINGNEANASNYSRGLPDATFTTDDKLSGNGGCNRFSGSYTYDDKGNLTIGRLMSTKMYCAGDGEGEFMKALGAANMAKIENDKLTLLNGTQELMVFVPKKAN
jgi:heat shock protein HslJ